MHAVSNMAGVMAGWKTLLVKARNAMRHAAFLALFLLGIPSFSAADVPVRQPGAIGVLALPQLFGHEPCERFTAQPLPLFAQPDAGEQIGEVRVDTPWTHHPQGGCEGLTVQVHLTGADAQPLPTVEYGYEQPGAVVLEQRDGWFRIELQDVAAWARPAAGHTFYSLSQLYANALTYLTAEWNGQLCAQPGDPSSCRAYQGDRTRIPSSEVLATREIMGVRWFEIRLPLDACGEEPEPGVPLQQGWVPAYGATGRPVIWFYSRGC